MQSYELKRIHQQHLAVYQKIYTDDDGLQYIGTKFGRLEVYNSASSIPSNSSTIQAILNSLQAQINAITLNAYKVKVNSVDTTPDFLGTKLIAGSNITLTPISTFGNYTLRIDGTGGGGGVSSVNSGNGITVDNTDPVNPIINAGGNAPAIGGITFTMNGFGNFYVDNRGMTGIHLGDTTANNGGAELGLASNQAYWDDPISGNHTNLFGINTIFPTEALHVVGSIRMVDGTEGIGLVLTDDGTGTGIATWATTGAGSSFLTANQIAFGDPTNIMTSSASFIYDDVNSYFGVSGNVNGGSMYFDDTTGIFAVTVMPAQFGITLDNATQTFTVFNPSSGRLALNLDYINQIYGIGDLNASLGQTYISINDLLGTITLNYVASGTAGIFVPTFASALETGVVTASPTGLLQKLPKNTSATRYLSNTGTDNAPAWAAVNLANGVTGTLPFSNLGTAALGNMVIAQGVGTPSIYSTSGYVSTSMRTPLVFGNTTASGTLTLQSTTNGTRGKIILGNNGTDSAYDEANVRLGIGTESPAYGIELTKTLTGATDYGAYYHVTTNATPGAKIGLRVDLLPTFTSTNGTYGIFANNLTAGTGNANFFDNNLSGNVGFQAVSDSTTTGTNVGATGIGRGGDINFGGFYTADTVKSGATNIGIGANVVNPTGGGFMVGGLFALGLNAITFESAALVADNGAESAPIFLAKDNGTTVVQIADGGNAFFGGATTPTAKIHIAASAGSGNDTPIKLDGGTFVGTPEVGSFEYQDPQLAFTNNTSIRQEIILSQQSRVITDFNDTTGVLADITGLTANVADTGYYSFEAILHVDADVTGGAQFAIAGTCIEDVIIYQISYLDNALGTYTISSRQVALAGAAGQVGTTIGFCKIEGLIDVKQAGTLTVQFAQSVSSGTSTVKTGSYFRVSQIV